MVGGGFDEVVVAAGAVAGWAVVEVVPGTTLAIAEAHAGITGIEACSSSSETMSFRSSMFSVVIAKFRMPCHAVVLSCMPISDCLLTVELVAFRARVDPNRPQFRCSSCVIGIRASTWLARSVYFCLIASVAVRIFSDFRWSRQAARA